MARKSDDKTRDRGRRHAGHSWHRRPRKYAAASPAPGPKGSERIAKVIARAGLCSRRDAEEWIAAGRVSVNGAVVTSPALNITPSDRVIVDGAALPARERTRLFLYHKPAGLVTTNDDPQGRPTIFDRLPKDLPRLLAVGRLDIGTEGLLLLTNDGGLARVLELPQTGWLRRYRVRAHGSVTQEQLDRLRSGLTVDEIHYGPIEATLDRVQGSNVWLTFAIREGKNREVRNVLRALGLQVNRLIRISFGPFQLAALPEGDVEEVRTRVLREQLGERVAQIAGCDFSPPIVSISASAGSNGERGAPERKDRETARTVPPRDQRHRGDRPERQRGDRPMFKKRGHASEAQQEDRGSKPRKPRTGNAWRAHDASGKRTFHGSRREGKNWPEETSGKRAGLLQDRKGRKVLVERFGAPKPQEPDPSDHPPRPKHRRPRRRDRSGGPRPSRPKGR
jgi:23S rRNA pseudouridine2605 synthase